MECLRRAVFGREEPWPLPATRERTAWSGLGCGVAGRVALPLPVAAWPLLQLVPHPVELVTLCSPRGLATSAGTAGNRSPDVVGLGTLAGRAVALDVDAGHVQPASLSRDRIRRSAV